MVPLHGGDEPFEIVHVQMENRVRDPAKVQLGHLRVAADHRMLQHEMRDGFEHGAAVSVSEEHAKIATLNVDVVVKRWQHLRNNGGSRTGSERGDRMAAR